MNILIVYAIKAGTIETLARVIGSGLEPDNRVRVVAARDAHALRGEHLDLLFVGAPTQTLGRRRLVRSFLAGLVGHGFGGVPAAAFDTQLRAPTESTTPEARTIAEYLDAAGCPLVVPPEGFYVGGVTGTLTEGERVRARIWAQGIVDLLSIARRDGRGQGR